MACLIGVDLGTSGAKSVLMTEGGEILARHTEPYSPDLSVPGRAEQDPDTYLIAACEGIGECLRQSRIRPGSVAGVGISGLAPALVLTDDSGVPLGRAPLWLDRRGAEIAARLNHGSLKERLVRLSGNPVDAFYGMVKLLWEKEHRPETYRRARWCFSAVNYVVCRMTGVAAVDSANASLFGLAFDIRQNRWDPDALAELGVRGELLPEPVPCEAIAGPVKPWVTEACGLLSGTPMTAGTVDGTATCVACRAVSPGDSVISLGTSALLYVVHAEPEFSGRLIALCHPSRDERLFTSVGAMSCGGVLLKYLKDLLGEDPDRLTELAGSVPPGSEGMVTLPYFEGERTPIWDPNARGVVSGLRLSQGMGHWVRSIMEGVAFGLRHNLDEVAGAGLPVTEPVIIAGGGAKSALWRQMVADVLRKRLLYVGEPGGAEVGAGLLAGVGTGAIPGFSANRDRPLEGTVVEPNPRELDRYEENYAVYRDLYTRLAPAFAAWGLERAERD